MINEESLNKVKEFLKSHPNPCVVVASTIRDGFVSCIKPVPTICGAELMCSPKTERELRDLITPTSMQE